MTVRQSPLCRLVRPAGARGLTRELVTGHSQQHSANGSGATGRPRARRAAGQPEGTPAGPGLAESKIPYENLSGIGLEPLGNEAQGPTEGTRPHHRQHPS